MRDLVALLVALALLAFAAGLAATLNLYRRRRDAARRAHVAFGRTIVADLPTGPDLTIFSEGPDDFAYGARTIDKEEIRAVRVLINGAPIASYESRRFPAHASAAPTEFDDPPEGIARDRWDVAIEMVRGEAVLVECGAIRERISQELARKIYDAVKADLERQDEQAGS
jgi:hypothetical protein